VNFVGTGTVTITAFAPGNNTYTTGSNSVILTVGKATPLITFTSPGTVPYSNNLIIALLASSTGDQALAFSSSKTNVASISGSNALVKGVGLTTLIASVTNDANYVAASNSQVLNVTKGTPVPDQLPLPDPGGVTTGSAYPPCHQRPVESWLPIPEATRCLPPTEAMSRSGFPGLVRCPSLPPMPETPTGAP